MTTHLRCNAAEQPVCKRSEEQWEGELVGIARIEEVSCLDCLRTVRKAWVKIANKESAKLR